MATSPKVKIGDRKPTQQARGKESHRDLEVRPVPGCEAPGLVRRRWVCLLKARGVSGKASGSRRAKIVIGGRGLESENTNLP